MKHRDNILMYVYLIVAWIRAISTSTLRPPLLEGQQTY